MTEPANSQPLLDVAGLRVTYGGVVAVSDVDLQIAEGTIFGLIGPNGAGKTSMVDALTGYTRQAAGRIVFDGRDIGRLRPYRRARLRPGPDVPVGRAVRRPHGRGEPAGGQRARDRRLHPPATCSCPGARWDRSSVDWAIEVCGLQDVAARYPGQISLGKRKLVGIGRALARGAQLVLLDEPAASLDTDESQELGQRLRALQAEHGVTIFLIDHDMGLVLSVCDQLMVLDFGRQDRGRDPGQDAGTTPA